MRARPPHSAILSRYGAIADQAADIRLARAMHLLLRMAMTPHGAAFAGLALLTVVACGPPPGMPPSPTNPPVRPPPPQTNVNGEVIGADRQYPGDELAVGVKVVVRPGDEHLVRGELGPGWYLDENGVPRYSQEEEKRVLGSPSAIPGTWEVVNGRRVFRPSKPASRPPAPASGAGQK